MYKPHQKAHLSTFRVWWFKGITGKLLFIQWSVFYANAVLWGERSTCRIHKQPQKLMRKAISLCKKSCIVTFPQGPHLTSITMQCELTPLHRAAAWHWELITIIPGGWGYLHHKINLWEPQSVLSSVPTGLGMPFGWRVTKVFISYESHGLNYAYTNLGSSGRAWAGKTWRRKVVTEMILKPW